MKFLQSVYRVNLNMHLALVSHTFWRRKCEYILSRIALRQSIALTEHVWVQFAELNNALSHTLHPPRITNVLRDKGGPDRNRLHRAASSGNLKTYAARVAVTEYAKCMQVS